MNIASTKPVVSHEPGNLSDRTRHLTAGQKAAIAAEALPHFESEAKKRQVINAKNNQPQNTEKIPVSDSGEAREKAAAQVGVNPRYVSDAKKIKEAAPDLRYFFMVLVFARNPRRLWTTEENIGNCRTLVSK